MAVQRQWLGARLWMMAWLKGPTLNSRISELLLGCVEPLGDSLKCGHDLGLRRLGHHVVLPLSLNCNRSKGVSNM